MTEKTLERTVYDHKKVQRLIADGWSAFPTEDEDGEECWKCTKTVR